MSDETAAISGVRTVKSADRALQLLEYLIQSPEPRTLKEVTEALQIPRASTYALLVTLQRRGWVDANDNRFSLGLRSLQAAVTAIDLDPTVRRTEQVRQRLNADLKETVHLARLDGADVVYIQSFTAPDRPSALTRPGRRLPAYACALGKALLATREWDEVDAALPQELAPVTSRTITSRPQLRSELEQIARDGYAKEVEENTLGLTCYAIAVPATPRPSYAISCSMPLDALEQEHHALVRDRLLQAAQRLAADVDPHPSYRAPA
ncbi:IclR family transcriptional regulator [Aeromicrobium piscarium]|uniref:IclR family transcriptional regulator n=1 Tax=Aeromicrobium piscarium TaxID=2590901 RepID=UPI00163D7C3D|nr:IclR family transcriptional regulator [Aeromicrobium piscarium]